MPLDLQEQTYPRIRAYPRSIRATIRAIRAGPIRPGVAVNAVAEERPQENNTVNHHHPAASETRELVSSADLLKALESDPADVEQVTSADLLKALED